MMTFSMMSRFEVQWLTKPLAQLRVPAAEPEERKSDADKNKVVHNAPSLPAPPPAA